MQQNVPLEDAKRKICEAKPQKTQNIQSFLLKENIF